MITKEEKLMNIFKLCRIEDNATVSHIEQEKFKEQRREVY
jgi:hypothetical protein